MMSALKSRPVLTNCLVCGTLFGAGDIVASVVQKRDINTASTLRAAIYGSCVYGVIAATVTYPILNNLAPKLRAFPRLCARIAVDQALFSPFIYTPMYFGVTSLLELQPPAEALTRIQTNWRSTVETSWSIWIPVQVLNFGVVPEHLRIVTVAVAGLVWNSILAFKNANSRGVSAESD